MPLSIQIKAIEEEIDLGQIEEVIEIAKDELKLIDIYYGKLTTPNFIWRAWRTPWLENRGWELIEEAQKEADLLVEDMADSIYFADPSYRKNPST